MAMGAFDAPTGTQLALHIFVDDKGDYYEIADDRPAQEPAVAIGCQLHGSCRDRPDIVQLQEPETTCEPNSALGFSRGHLHRRSGRPQQRGECDRSVVAAIEA